MAVQAAKKIAKEAIKKAITWVTKDLTLKAAKAGVKQVFKAKGLDLAQQVICETMKCSFRAYLKKQEAAFKQVEGYMDKVFKDSTLGVANIEVIGPTLATAAGYKDQLLPHQLMKLMNLTIKWGRQEVERIYEQNVSLFVGIVGATTGVHDLWHSGLGPHMARAKSVVERRQKVEVSKMVLELQALMRKATTVYCIVKLESQVARSPLHNHFCIEVERNLINERSYTLKNGGRIGVYMDPAERPKLAKWLHHVMFKRPAIYRIRIGGHTFPAMPKQKAYRGHTATIEVFFEDMQTSRKSLFRFKIDGKPSLGILLGENRAQDEIMLRNYARQLAAGFVEMVNQHR